MPKVGGKSYAYTPKGMAAAAKARKKLKNKNKRRSGMSRTKK